MEHIDRIAMMECLAIGSSLALRPFCDRFRQILDLPELRLDSENETEWGLVEVDGIEYNVSRPYEDGTLQDWDHTVPADCNFGITLIVYCEHAHANNYDWAFNHLVVPAAQKLANGFGLPVYHHRTWLGPGNNVQRHVTFDPDLA